MYFGLREKWYDATHVMNSVVWAGIVREFVVNIADVTYQVGKGIWLSRKFNFKNIVENREKLVDHGVTCTSTESVKSLKDR